VHKLCTVLMRTERALVRPTEFAINISWIGITVLFRIASVAKRVAANRAIRVRVSPYDRISSTRWSRENLPQQSFYAIRRFALNAACNLGDIDDSVSVHRGGNRQTPYSKFLFSSKRSYVGRKPGMHTYCSSHYELHRLLLCAIIVCNNYSESKR